MNGPIRQKDRENRKAEKAKETMDRIEERGFNKFLAVTEKFPFTNENLGYVLGSHERHSISTPEMCMPLRPTQN